MRSKHKSPRRDGLGPDDRFTSERWARDDEPEPRTARVWDRWIQFWFSPAAPLGLHTIRVFTGLLILVSLLPLAGQVENLFGLDGWFDTRAYGEITSRLEPNQRPILDWSVLFLVGEDPALLRLTYWLAIGVFALFTLGVATRLTSVLSWLFIVSFTANPLLRYEGDTLLRVLALYLMVGYLFLGQSDPNQSLLQRLLGPNPLGLFGWFGRMSAPPRGSVAANLAVRLLQVHFAVIMLASGLHKLQFGDWWGGVALWYPLYPPFDTTMAEVLRNKNNREAFLFWLSLTAYVTMAWQIAFPLYAWRRAWRLVLVGGGVIGWIGIAYFYGHSLPIIGPAILIGCLSFLTPEEWNGWFDWLSSWPGLGWLERRPAEAPTPTPPAVPEETPSEPPSVATVEQR